jgi:hypothetical protein
MPVLVETVLLRAERGELRYRMRTREIPDGAHPDPVARDLAGFSGTRTDPARLLHSTSWRFVAGRVVLTYAALPDPEPAATHLIDPDRALPYAPDPLSPALPAIRPHDVAVHACRHLAYLRRTDPVVALTAQGAPDLWELIGTLRPALAGALTG